MIGASALTSKESTFHSMNAKKIKGAKETIKLIKNSVKISSICNDIVGDICGIISGGLGAVLAISIANLTKFNGVKMVCSYEVRFANTNEIAVTGYSTHCFVDENFKPFSLKRKYPKIYNKFIELLEKK